MQDQKHGRLIKRSLYEEYESSRGEGLCLDPHDPAFLGTICFTVLVVIVVALFYKMFQPTPILINPTEPLQQEKQEERQNIENRGPFV